MNGPQWTKSFENCVSWLNHNQFIGYIFVFYTLSCAILLAEGDRKTNYFELSWLCICIVHSSNKRTIRIMWLLLLLLVVTVTRTSKYRICINRSFSSTFIMDHFRNVYANHIYTHKHNVRQIYPNYWHRFVDLFSFDCCWLVFNRLYAIE